jgi:hypothetical protein
MQAYVEEIHEMKRKEKPADCVLQQTNRGRPILRVSIAAHRRLRKRSMARESPRTSAIIRHSPRNQKARADDIIRSFGLSAEASDGERRPLELTSYGRAVR